MAQALAQVQGVMNAVSAGALSAGNVSGGAGGHMWPFTDKKNKLNCYFKCLEIGDSLYIIYTHIFPTDVSTHQVYRCFWNVHMNQIRQGVPLLRSFGNPQQRYSPQILDSFKSNQRSETFRSLPLAGTGEAAMGAAAVAASASANLEVLRAGLEREAQARVALGSETAEQLKQMLGPNVFFWEDKEMVLEKYWWKRWKSFLEIHFSFFSNGVSISLRPEISSIPFLGGCMVVQSLTLCGMRISDMVYELNNRQQQQQASVQQHQQQNAAQDEKVPHSEGPGSLEKAFCGMKLQKMMASPPQVLILGKKAQGLTNNKKG